MRALFKRILVFIHGNFESNENVWSHKYKMIDRLSQKLFSKN